MTLPTPDRFGLPEIYNSWRENQANATEAILEDSPRFLLLSCPTGFGKSLCYLTASMIRDGRTCILTSTKGLQRQLVRDYDMDDVVEIKGRGNYQCRLNTRLTCDLGPCIFGYKCPMEREGGCPYFDRWKEACKAKIVITNYAYYLNQCEFGRGLGTFNTLVLDEAHDANEHLLSHLSVVFDKTNRFQSDVLKLDRPVPKTLDGWKEWGGMRIEDLLRRIQRAKDNRKEKRYNRLKKLYESVNRLLDIDSSWVWDDGDVFVQISPTWAGPYAEEFLFRQINKVVLTSATIVEKTANLLNIPKENYSFLSYPHSFPKESRQLVHIPTLRMNKNNTPMEARLWLNRVDQIIKDRAQDKGIVHTISYARRDLLLQHSKYKDFMITHETQDAAEKVDRFKKLPAPLILVSPSMTTGWDFPYDECRWQIIVKLPFPDIRDYITRKRMKDDPDFIPYLVIQQLTQACGRGTRAEDDYCETFILDDNIERWFLPKFRHLALSWFLEAYTVSKTVPSRKTENNKTKE